MKISGWGNNPSIDANINSISADDNKVFSAKSGGIARGMGRSYGDAALSENVFSMLKLNRILSLNEKDNSITVESGVILDDLLKVIVPKGWFVPVTPGTRFVTIGGMVASDVHGKNHHKDGSFGHHIQELKLLLSNGEKVFCNHNENSDLFFATIGGMGLTGIVLEVTFSLIKIETGYIKQERVRASNLNEIMNLFEESENWKYSVAWIDCVASGSKLGRSVLMRGKHANQQDLPKPLMDNPLKVKHKRKINIPFNFPSYALNSFSIKLFNTLYYHKAPERSFNEIIDYNEFFYPLDALYNWNRIYGAKGFFQYQFVLPKDISFDVLPDILERIAKAGNGSFLAVLKLFGGFNKPGLLSFPEEGYTLALDFPATRKTLLLLDELDSIIHEAGGKIYLAKDARVKDVFFQKSYKKLSKFIEVKKKFDKKGYFYSLQSKRIGINK